MNSSIIGLSVCVVVVGLFAGTELAAGMETVPVGNPGNAGDTRYSGGWSWSSSYGSVASPYSIGKYEVTAGEYKNFLNSVAGVDTYGLYSTLMSSNSQGCKIVRSGGGTVVNPYTYSVAPELLNRPVNYVGWGDAARFANWMHNGQLGGAQNASTTEDGSYALNGAVLDAALMAVTRKVDATWVLPNENEWYKAAYHKNDGVLAHYFDYPTSSNNISSSMANYGQDYNVGQTTIVGSYASYPSPYGTFDQGGNINEWPEALMGGTNRGWRGGSFIEVVDFLHANAYNPIVPTSETRNVGFRVAKVPGPATLSLVVAALSVVESAGPAATTITITRNTATTNALTVDLTSSDTSEATVPATAIIPANQVSVVVPLDAMDDPLEDGTQTVTLTASAVGFVSGTATVQVTDNEIRYADWAAMAGLTDANALPGAIPFGDGVRNLIKYAFNMNGAGSDAHTLVRDTGTSGLPCLLHDGSVSVFRYEYLRRKNSGLVYTPKQSTTLGPGSWVPMAGTQTVTDTVDAAWARVVIVHSYDPEGTPECFLRVDVALP